MSLLYLKLATPGTLPHGTILVWADLDQGTVRPFDSLTDSSEDIVGVVYPKTNTEERCASNNDGPVFYSNGFTVFNDDLTTNNVPNPDYTWINLELSEDYVRVCVRGFAAILKPYTVIRNDWRLIQRRTTHDWFIL